MLEGWCQTYIVNLYSSLYVGLMLTASTTPFIDWKTETTLGKWNKWDF